MNRARKRRDRHSDGAPAVCAGANVARAVSDTATPTATARFAAVGVGRVYRSLRARRRRREEAKVRTAGRDDGEGCPCATARSGAARAITIKRGVCPSISIPISRRRSVVFMKETICGEGIMPRVIRTEVQDGGKYGYSRRGGGGSSASFHCT
jgi:hypothetical protein